MEKRYFDFIIKIIEEDSTLLARKLLEIIKSKFDLEIGRATIVKILKRNWNIYKQDKKEHLCSHRDEQIWS